ncbi:histidine kinase [Spirosoma sp. BT702]|uniref:Histidine kinase n=1 Tax=Spirosoma profusum TaxID=2771354 RepID=A0A926XV22_9BACT|nr:histidine kinase [Spirosoma profusum]MBD2700201.1 histidine kinase [Spirosoma profusum]
MQRLNKEFVFSSQPRYRLARHGLFWLTWMLFFAVIYSFLPINYLIQKGMSWPEAFALGFSRAVIDSILFIPAHMFFTYVIIDWIVPQFLLKSRYWWTLITVVGLMVLTALLSASLTTFVVDPIRIWLRMPTSGNNFFFAILAGLRGAITVGGFAAAIKLAKAWYLKQEAYQQIDREKLQAELQLLKSQIHPHFLFNTLNNLYALTLHKSDRSPAIVLKLSELLSYMLYECNATEVPLQKEIAFMRNYIGLEQLRYGERLDMSVNITGEYGNKQIAPLLLVPFLENAFKHGASEQLEQAWMHIDLSVQDNMLKFKVINSCELADYGDAPLGGIGLQNVTKRLQLLYPNRHEQRIVTEQETFMVTLTLELATTSAPLRLPESELIEAV